MPCLTSCCCGFSVKAGTRAIAILSVVSLSNNFQFGKWNIFILWIVKYFFTSKSEIFSLGLFCVWTVDGGNIQSWEGQVAGETVQHSSTLAVSTTEVGKYFTELVSKLFDQVWWAPASRLEWSQQKRWWRWWGWRRWREWSNSPPWRTYPYLERLQPH